MKQETIDKLVKLLKDNKPKIKTEKDGFVVEGIKYKIPSINIPKQSNPNIFR